MVPMASHKVMESIQRKAINMISGLRASSYEEKLTELGLESLTERRLRLDMLQTFKILKGIDNVDYTKWFQTYGDIAQRRTTRLADHPLNIVMRSVPRLEIRKNFFSNRVIRPWNNLPNFVKDSVNVKLFKSNYDSYIKSMN